MKTLKVLALAVALVVCNTASAQFSNTGSQNKSKSTTSSNISGIQKGYKGFVEGNFCFGEWFLGGVLTTHGYQINPWIFVGGGTGFSIVDGEFLVPLFGDIRINFLNSNITPYFDGKVGYSIGGGFYADPSIGCRFGFGGNAAIYFAAGYEVQMATVYYKYNNHSYYYRANIGGFALKLGFEF